MNNGWIRRLGRPLGALTLGLGLWTGSVGCHVPPPKPQALLKFGFGSPGQTFRSFATAMQGELLDPLYDSFSSRFKTDNELSRTGSQEAYDHMMAESPLLRWALYQATKDPEQLRYELYPDGATALVETTYRGRLIQVFLVREAYWELNVMDLEDPSADPRREADANLPDLFLGGSGGMRLEAKDRLLWAYSPAPNGGVDSISSLRSGYEWKVDNFHVESIP